MKRCMKCLIPVMALTLLAAAPVVAEPSKGGYTTIHTEQESPRPAGVTIAGAKPGQVVLYCTTISAGCKGMRKYFAERGTDTLDKELTTDPVAQAEFEALGGLGVPLLVFKDTLLHGYYPSGFERVYARQLGTPDAQRESARAIAKLDPLQRNARSADAGAGQSSASPSGKPGQTAAAPVSPVEIVAPAAIAAYIQSHPDVLVQFTSPDAGCRYCVEAYQGFDATARAHGGSIRFVRVEWTPWRDFPEEIKALHGGGYVPVQIAYRAGKETGRFDGTLMNKSREFGAFIKQRFAPGATYPDSAAAVDEIQPEQLADYLARHPRATIQLTSPDPNCQPCAASYAAFDAAATHASRIRFARVQWMPWQSVPALLKQTYALRVVPEVKGFRDGQLAGTLTGITQPRLEAWLKQQFGAQP